MISSMTGYGRGEFTVDGISVVVEARSVNNRFLEVATRLPRTMALRENDVKELVRKKIARGKINLVISVEHANADELPLKINRAAAKAYHKLLLELREATGIEDEITIEHLLKFSEVLEGQEMDATDEGEWLVTQKALDLALESLATMRMNEGSELQRDLSTRLTGMEQKLGEIERMSASRMGSERAKMHERIHQLVEDPTIIEEKRLELELAILADKLDITEECVRFRSHIKFFLQAMEREEAAGRKLNFLLQEMNREANTIGSKSYDAEIAQAAVGIKEEMEKIREQLQNIE